MQRPGQRSAFVRPPATHGGSVAMPETGGHVHGAGNGRTTPELALHVCTRYQRGGSERRVRDCIRAVPELRHHLLLGAESDADLALRQTGAERVWVLPTLVRQVDPVRDAASLVSLWRLLRRRVYSVAVSHQSKAGILTRAAAAAAGGPPAVHSLSMASFGPGYGRVENLLFQRLERLLGTRTTAYCVVGEDLAHRFGELGIPADRLHVVRSGIPLPTRRRPRDEARRLLDERFGTVPGRPVVCYVGSLEPRKNPLLLPTLLARLQDTGPGRPQLVVVGDGPLRPRLAEELRSLGLTDPAVLTGYLAEPEQVHDVLRAVDAVVLLSEAEGLPQVLVQSAAAGTPFVAFDVEGVREVLSLGARGTAVPLGDLDGAADAVTGWLTTSTPADREPVADLTSWAPATIAASYRAVFDRALRPARSVPSG
ncbi:glycosyltransferase [Geodermatophilus sp. SYSU D01176]